MLIRVCAPADQVNAGPAAALAPVQTPSVQDSIQHPNIIMYAQCYAQIKFALDPLLHVLTSHYVDDSDLRDRLRRLFEV